MRRSANSSVAASLVSAVTIGKIGSNVNYLLELCAALSLASGVVIAASEKHLPVRSAGALIVIGLALYATTFLAGLLFLGPEAGRVGKLTAEGSPEAGPRTLRLIFFSRLDLALLFLLVYDMAVKPELGDASFFWGVAGAVVAGGLVYWRYRAALALGPAPAPERSGARSGCCSRRR